MSLCLLAAGQRGSFRASSVRAEFEVVNLPLNQLPFGLKLLLPHTHNTDHFSSPRKHEDTCQLMSEQALLQQTQANVL